MKKLRKLSLQQLDKVELGKKTGRAAVGWWHSGFM